MQTDLGELALLVGLGLVLAGHAALELQDTMASCDGLPLLVHHLAPGGARRLGPAAAAGSSRPATSSGRPCRRFIMDSVLRGPRPPKSSSVSRPGPLPRTATRIGDAPRPRSPFRRSRQDSHTPQASSSACSRTRSFRKGRRAPGPAHDAPPWSGRSPGVTMRMAVSGRVPWRIASSKACRTRAGSRDSRTSPPRPRPRRSPWRRAPRPTTWPRPGGGRSGRARTRRGSRPLRLALADGDARDR